MSYGGTEVLLKSVVIGQSSVVSVLLICRVSSEFISTSGRYA